ncbi:PhoX family protein [Sphingomonas sp.]|uniref:PhoX family protein n=1 Tax=Sphingomonas sp. TaxID=28214 RepID=UPI002DD61FE3|nr:alkaline phosphatase PhoX [Sphingomonas sp.]
MTDLTRSAHTIGDLIARRYSRRDALRGSASAAAMTVVGGSLLAACGGGGGNASPGDPAPIVTATATPTTTTAGNRITIAASATDNGTVTGITYVQVSGAPVTLSATTGGTTSFIAPAVATVSTIVIRVTATDNSGNTGVFDLNVTASPGVLGFAAVAKNRDDRVTIPAGYSIATLVATGDPIAAGTAAYANNGSDGDFTTRIGDHAAGFVYFGLTAAGTGIDVSNSARGLLAISHEGITQAYLHPAGPTAPGGTRPTAEVVKEIEAHGVSIVDAAAAAGNVWSRVQDSALNRRVTPNTAVLLNGAVKGTANLQTAFSTDGTAGRGTIGNAQLGATGWGTAIAGEEKWARYFRRPPASDDARRTAKELTALRRYGITGTDGLYGWATAAAAGSQYARWDAQATGSGAPADYRNEPNQFGWVIEVDPYDKAASVRKRTSLGRFAHAGLLAYPAIVGVKPGVYMTDGGQDEYLYKFVSNTAWASADAAATDRMAIGDKYLDTGTLYVAKFAADGTGSWVPLTFGQNGLDAANTTFSFTDQADVLVHARLAGDVLQATKMDRPQGLAANMATGEIVLALNGNDARNAANTNPANPRAYVDPPSAQVGNRNGHVLRIKETGTTEATAFTWDVYAFGAGADLDATNINVSALDATNDFSGPEGIGFAKPGNPAGTSSPLMFIRTDDAAYRDVTNNQMLVGLGGGLVGDNGTAAAKTINNSGTEQATRLGKPPVPAALRRFLVGPNEAAITGVDTSPDGRTLFVNVQHPGETGSAAAPTSNWPANQSGAAAGVRPRSATIVIQRTDGGIIGL